MVSIVGYFFLVPSITGRTNRAYFTDLPEAVNRAKINGATQIYYHDEHGVERFVMEVAR